MELFCRFLIVGRQLNFLLLVIGSPLGAVASKRYALLNRVPLLPHEELLCKEAMLRYMVLQYEDLEFSSPDLDSHHSVKVSFVKLMRFHHQARWSLMKSRACDGVLTSFPWDHSLHHL